VHRHCRPKRLAAADPPPGQSSPFHRRGSVAPIERTPAAEAGNVFWKCQRYKRQTSAATDSRFASGIWKEIRDFWRCAEYNVSMYCYTHANQLIWLRRPSLGMSAAGHARRLRDQDMSGWANPRNGGCSVLPFKSPARACFKRPTGHRVRSISKGFVINKYRRYQTPQGTRTLVSKSRTKFKKWIRILKNLRISFPYS